MSSESEFHRLIETTIISVALETMTGKAGALEALVRAALTSPVSAIFGNRYVVAGPAETLVHFVLKDEIKRATHEAIRKVLAERLADIEASVRKGLDDGSFVSAATAAIMNATRPGYHIKINFEREK